MRLESFSTAADPERFRADFFSLPERVRAPEYRAGRLPAELRRRCLTAPLPFESEFWLCYQGTVPVGGIGASLPSSLGRSGFFGFLELDLERESARCIRLLLDATGGWLRERGVVEAIGPVDLCTWFPYRLRLDDGDERSFDWEPANPPQYVELLESTGFTITDRYTTTGFDGLAEHLARTRPGYERAVREGFRFRELDADGLRGEQGALYRITIESFLGTYLFEPIPQSLFVEIFSLQTSARKRSISSIVSAPDGQDAGFLFAFLDRWEGRAGAETMIVHKTLAVRPSFRGRGLSHALSHLAIARGREMDARYAVAALVRSENRSESIARKGRFRWRHDYGLWKKSIET